jgi:hypothetical protein
LFHIRKRNDSESSWPSTSQSNEAQSIRAQAAPENTHRHAAPTSKAEPAEAQSIRTQVPAQNTDDKVAPPPTAQHAEARSIKIQAPAGNTDRKVAAPFTTEGAEPQSIKTQAAPENTDDKAEPPSTTQQAEARSIRIQTPPENTDDKIPRPLELKGIWKEAYEKLCKEEPELIEAFEKDLQQSPATQHQGAASLSQIVQDKITNIERSRWKVTVAGKEVTGHDKVLRIVEAIVSVKEAITAAVATEPHAALAWAGILLLLNVRKKPIYLERRIVESC